MIAFYCNCGWSTTEAHAAFLHRDQSGKHIIKPLTREEAEAQGLTVPFDAGRGIDRHFALQDNV